MVSEKASAWSSTAATWSSCSTRSARLARAYNTVVPSSGKVLTGRRRQRPAAAEALLRRCPNIEDGGSLTIIATALIDTGSRMDEVIFEEFKGTGNSESCSIAAWRTSGCSVDRHQQVRTRKEELLVDRATLSRMWVLRRILSPMGTMRLSSSRTRCVRRRPMRLELDERLSR